MTPREWIGERARELGFDACGVARLPRPPEAYPEGQRFREWLARGYAAGMAWLERTAEARTHPGVAWPEMRSAVVLGWRHPGPGAEPAPGEGRVASYARGRDYHNVLGRRLRRLRRELSGRWPQAAWRLWVDTGPVLEKALAARAGLGWLGKNTLLLHPERGSRVLLGVLLTSLELEPSPPVTDQCGACRLCLEACPTGAFPAPGVLDSRRCLSYYTIEDRGDMPVEIREQAGDHLFGCDVCQDVCPWNYTTGDVPLHPAFGEPDVPLHEALDGILRLTEESFSAYTRGRPLARARRAGLARNAAVVAGNSQDHRHVEALGECLADAEPTVRRHAAWALGRLGGDRARALLRARLGGEEDGMTREEVTRALGAAEASGG